MPFLLLHLILLVFVQCARACNTGIRRGRGHAGNRQKGTRHSNAQGCSMLIKRIECSAAEQLDDVASDLSQLKVVVEGAGASYSGEIVCELRLAEDGRKSEGEKMWCNLQADGVTVD